MKLTSVPMIHVMDWLMKIANSIVITRINGMLTDLNANMIRTSIAMMDNAEVRIRSLSAVLARSAIRTASPVDMPPSEYFAMICRMASTCTLASNEPAS